jgi:hypothetical protein
MDRRGFLKSLAALAAAAATPAAFANIGQVDKYARALELYEDCRGITDKAEATKKFDLVLAHLKENFRVPEVTEENNAAVWALLNMPGEELMLKATKLPPVIAEELFTVSLLRMALKFDQFPINPSYMSNFIWFANTHGKVVLAASYLT